MSTRFTLMSTKYGGPGIYDADTRTVAAFVDDAAAQAALLAILDGTHAPATWVWRDAYPSEVV